MWKREEFTVEICTLTKAMHSYVACASQTLFDSITSCCVDCRWFGQIQILSVFTYKPPVRLCDFCLKRAQQVAVGGKPPDDNVSCPLHKQHWQKTLTRSRHLLWGPVWHLYLKIHHFGSFCELVLSDTKQIHVMEVKEGGKENRKPLLKSSTCFYVVRIKDKMLHSCNLELADCSLYQIVSNNNNNKIPNNKIR